MDLCDFFFDFLGELFLVGGDLLLVFQIFLDVESFRVNHHTVKFSIGLLKADKLKNTWKFVSCNEVFHFWLDSILTFFFWEIHCVGLDNHNFLFLTEDTFLNTDNFNVIDVVILFYFEKHTSSFYAHSPFIWLTFMHHSKSARKRRLFPFSGFLNIFDRLLTIFFVNLRILFCWRLFIVVNVKKLFCAGLEKWFRSNHLKATFFHFIKKVFSNFLLEFVDSDLFLYLLK